MYAVRSRALTYEGFELVQLSLEHIEAPKKELLCTHQYQYMGDSKESGLTRRYLTGRMAQLVDSSWSHSGATSSSGSSSSSIDGFFLADSIDDINVLTLSAVTAAASTSSAVGIRSRVSGAYCLLSHATLVLLVVGVTPCAVFTATGFAAALVPRVVVLVRAPLTRECVSVASVDLERDGRWGESRAYHAAIY